MGRSGYKNPYSCVRLGVPGYAHSTSDRLALLRALTEAPAAAESVDMHFHVLACRMLYPRAIIDGFDEQGFRHVAGQLCPDAVEGLLPRALSRLDLVLAVRGALSQQDPRNHAVWKHTMAAASWPQNEADAKERHELLHAQGGENEDERLRGAQLDALAERIAGGLRAHAAITCPPFPAPAEASGAPPGSGG